MAAIPFTPTALVCCWLETALSAREQTQKEHEQEVSTHSLKAAQKYSFAWGEIFAQVNKEELTKHPQRQTRSKPWAPSGTELPEEGAEA